MQVRTAFVWLLGLLLLLSATGANIAQQPPPQQSAAEVVAGMLKNEAAARKTRQYYSFISMERSTRTGGHLWKEKVVETPEGVMRRLLEEDGKPLTPARAADEDRRVAELAAHPEEFQAANADRRGDEARLTRLLEILPRAFILEAAGREGECDRIAYRPNPTYVPATYEERIVHGMAGTVLVHTPDLRLCGIDGHLVDRVSFGYGLLGHVEKGSRFKVTRALVTPTDWKTSHISVHMDGKLLMLKSISRDQESVHTDMQLVPPHPSLAQVAALTRP
jgi:hypothetical protein